VPSCQFGDERQLASTPFIQRRVRLAFTSEKGLSRT